MEERRERKKNREERRRKRKAQRERVDRGCPAETRIPAPRAHPCW